MSSKNKSDRKDLVEMIMEQSVEKQCFYLAVCEYLRTKREYRAVMDEVIKENNRLPVSLKRNFVKTSTAFHKTEKILAELEILLNIPDSQKKKYRRPEDKFLW